jgi:hypothetical protein
MIWIAAGGHVRLTDARRVGRPGHVFSPPAFRRFASFGARPMVRLGPLRYCYEDDVAHSRRSRPWRYCRSMWHEPEASMFIPAHGSSSLRLRPTRAVRRSLSVPRTSRSPQHACWRTVESRYTHWEVHPHDPITLKHQPIPTRHRPLAPASSSGRGHPGGGFRHRPPRGTFGGPARKGSGRKRGGRPIGTRHATEPAHQPGCCPPSGGRRRHRGSAKRGRARSMARTCAC